MGRTWQEHVLHVFCPCSALVVFMCWTGNSMNNLLSYCGLIDAKIRASDKDLSVLCGNFQCHSEQTCKSEYLFEINSVRYLYIYSQENTKKKILQTKIMSLSFLCISIYLVNWNAFLYHNFFNTPKLDKVNKFGPPKKWL